MQSLHRLGLSHVLRMYLCGVRGGTGEGKEGEGDMEEYLYESAWRCTRWDEGGGTVGVGLGSGRKGYHQHLFNCMTNLRDKETSSLQQSLDEAR